jgi:hypothetical protein
MMERGNFKGPSLLLLHHDPWWNVSQIDFSASMESCSNMSAVVNEIDTVFHCNNVPMEFVSQIQR